MNSPLVVTQSGPARKRPPIRTAARIVATGLGVAAAAYAGSVALSWFRFGSRLPISTSDEMDPLLDRFMPNYEVVERHHVRVAAPAEITMDAAREQDLLASPVIRAIFKVRELALGSTPDERARPKALLPQVLSLGWGVLADIPAREIVMGAVTRPWEPNPRFRAIGPDQFAAFHEPDYVKIVWSLRADPLAAHESMFRTETRAVATDALARLKFRRYWALVSPGVALIRRMSLGPLKADAERRAGSKVKPMAIERAAGYTGFLHGHGVDHARAAALNPAQFNQMPVTHNDAR
jgi:hypothetical protein